MATGEELALFYAQHGERHGGEYTWDQVAELFDEVSGNAARAKANRAGYGENGFDPGPDDEHGVVFVAEGNTAEARSLGKRVTTLPDLLSAANVNPGVWRVDRYVVNKWEVGAKTDLGELIVEPLFQVKAWLTRRKLEPLFPTIQPVVPVGGGIPPPVLKRKSVHRAVLWADAHTGYRRDLAGATLEPLHDRRALDIVLQIIEAASPDVVAGLGDTGDYTVWTDKFIREPAFAHTTQPMLCELHWWLAQMRELAPNAEIVLHQGNHEERVDKQMQVHLAEAYQLQAVGELHFPPAMSLERLLGLHLLHIKWVGGYPDDEYWLSPVICLRHGDRARAPGGTGRAISREVDYTTITGHIHRAETVMRKVHTRDGDRAVLAHCIPCLCHLDGRVPGSNQRADWHQGLAVLDYEPEGTYYNLTHVPIQDGRAVWNGKLFEARDRLPEIAEAYPDWHWR